MASNSIKRFERGWERKISKDLLDRIQDWFDPYEYHIPTLHSHTIHCSTIDYSVPIGRELQMDMF